MVQNGQLIMLSPPAPAGGESEAKWEREDVHEKTWTEPNGEALSCMHVREGNTSLVAVACKSGIHILDCNESGFLVPSPPFLCCVRNAAAPSPPPARNLPQNASVPVT